MKILTKKELALYVPGHGCECAAHAECECGCGVDWTPKQLHEANYKLSQIEKKEKKQILENRDFAHSLIDSLNDGQATLQGKPLDLFMDFCQRNGISTSRLF